MSERELTAGALPPSLMRRLLRRRRRRGTGEPRRVWRIGVAILGVLAIVALLGPLVTPSPTDTNAAEVLAAPSWSHPFGTDTVGRDVLARVVAAARLDLWLGLAIAILASTVGSLFGLVAGYWGGWLDELVMRIADILLAFPGFVLSMLLVATLGNSIRSVMIAVTIAYIPHFIRLTRAEVLRQREMEYVQAARLSGNRDRRIALRHVLPNSLRPSAVQATLVVGWGILDVAGLAFLGLGIRPPTPEWGVMVAQGAENIITGEWWTSLIPATLVAISVLAFHCIGDDLEEQHQ